MQSEICFSKKLQNLGILIPEVFHWEIGIEGSCFNNCTPLKFLDFLPKCKALLQIPIPRVAVTLILVRYGVFVLFVIIIGNVGIGHSKLEAGQ